MFIRQKGAVHQPKLITNELGEVRVQAQAALLCVQEDSHQPARLFSKYSRRNRVDLPVQNLESIDRLAGAFPGIWQPGPQGQLWRFGQQCEALLDRPGDEENIPR